jgi:hypothetical protein
MAETQGSIRWREIALLVIILIVATVLRTWRLTSVPPGLTHDEAGHGQDAIAILNGARPIYETVGYGREPLYDYWVAGLMALVGRTQEVLRFSAVPLGLMTLFATFAWTRLAHGGAVALASTALQCISFWSLSAGRQALRSSLLPLLLTIAVYFYWRFLHGPGEGDAGSTVSRPGYWRLALFALLIGATLYTYVPARVLWIIFPVFLCYLALFHRPISRRVSLPTLVAVSLGLLLAVPLLVYLRTHPGAEQRLTMLDAPLQALVRGDVSLILSRAWHFVSGFLIPGQGDDFLAYTIPGRPIFDPLTGALFVIGLGICLSRWREPACAFSLMWFLIGISPSLVTGAAASTTRSIAALPVVFLFPALAVVAGVRWAGERWGDRESSMVATAFGGLILIAGLSSSVDYFVTWGESPQTRAAYQHTLVETARYLDAEPAGGLVAISTAQPYAPHDPYVFELTLRRNDLSMRWFDGRRALLLPSEPSARLVIPSSAALAPSFAELPGLQAGERVEMRPDDLDPYFTVHEWRPRLGLATLQRRMQNSSVSSSREAAMSEARQAQGNVSSDLDLPVNFGDALQLLGYELRTPTAAPGGTVELVTLWQAMDPRPFRPEDRADVGSEPVLFIHALAATGTLIAQEDRLDAPAWNWREGDVIAQSHRIGLPRDLPQGPVHLELGVYRQADLRRLPVLVDGTSGAQTSPIGDSVFLQPVEVEVEER